MSEGSCDESEIKTEKSDTYDNCFSDDSYTETINSVAPDELLDNSASLKPFHIDFNAGKESDTLQKKKNTVTLHIVHISSTLPTE